LLGVLGTWLWYDGAGLAVASISLEQVWVGSELTRPPEDLGWKPSFLPRIQAFGMWTLVLPPLH
jgi:hypothetical protein